MYSKSIRLGEEYITARKTIVILFADFEISGLEEIHKYFSKWHICEDEYKNVVLTKNLEIYIIELPKFRKYANNSKLSTWVKFIMNPEEIGMSETNNNESLKKAQELLTQISADEEEQELAFQRLMYIMDQKAIEAAGFDKGEKNGIKKGIQQGEKNEKIKIAKKMLNENVDINIIIKCTELSKEEIEKIK